MTTNQRPDWAAEWTANCSDARFTDPAQVKRNTTMFEKKIRRRNAIEYIAGALVVAVFAFVTFNVAAAGEWLMAIAGGLIIVGAIVVMWNLHRRASNLVASPEVDCHTHLRNQLKHQHSALASVPKWYVGPLVPGTAAFILAVAYGVAQVTGWGIALAGIALPTAFVAVIFGGVIWLNRRAAAALLEQIAQLDGDASQA